MIPPVPDDPESDRRPPVLQSLRFDPPEIVDGTVTTLIVTMGDDLSGVRTVTGNLRSPSGAAVLAFQAQGESGGTLFTARIPIPRKAESGVWHVGNIFAVDRADNTLITTFTAATAPAGGTMLVSSSESDSTAPEVRSLWMEKGAVRDGEKNVVSVEVVDDRSGVASVTGAFQSPSKAALIPFLCRLNAESHLWEGDVLVPLNADCGDWTVQQLRVVDSAGNIGYLNADAPQTSRVSFNVASAERCDSTPPTLESFSLNPTTVSNEAATEIVVTASIRDDGSGPLSMTGWITGPTAANGQAPRIFFSCARNANDPQAPWTGRFMAPQYAAKGIWRVGLVRLQDKAHNARDYRSDDPILAQGTMEVQ